MDPDFLGGVWWTLKVYTKLLFLWSQNPIELPPSLLTGFATVLTGREVKLPDQEDFSDIAAKSSILAYIAISVFNH